MSSSPAGTVLRGDMPAFVAQLERGFVFIWRELPQGAEATLWQKGSEVPSGWSGGSYAWKAIGEHHLLIELWKKNPPPGSRAVAIRGSAQLQVDLRKSSLKFKGDRHKRVLIVDDSPTIRKILRHTIESFGDWEIVGELAEAEGLAKALDDLLPDVVTLDLHLGQMDGAEAMRRFLAPRRVPTILISSQPKEDGGLVMEALAAGAMDYMQKPESGQLGIMRDELQQKFEAMLRSRWQTGVSNTLWKAPAYSFLNSDSLIVIGSSTGGTQALQESLLALPNHIPPMLITRHIPPVFSRALAERFNTLCPFEVKEAAHGDELLPNRIMIAPGGHHMRLSSDGKRVCIEDDAPVNRFRPSVDALFMSVAKYSRRPVVATILTGMGRDGAAGLLELRTVGHYTIAQDEKSSIVFGMPRAAIELGAAMKVEPLNRMAQALVEGVRNHQPKISKTV